ncbi:MAG: hypothetical protein HYY24_22575 [Verrucomicrobia bacterium]|nr:hypothetical protein [Verrucomicrobiota bacterium]
MALGIRLLGAGVISGAATTVLYPNSNYPVPAGVLGAIINNVRIVNTHATNSTQVNLYYTPSGGSQLRILDQNKSINAGDLLVVKPDLTMVPADKIELVSASGASLEWVVSGVDQK